MKQEPLKLIKTILGLGIIALLIVVVVFSTQKLESFIYPIKYAEYVEPYAEENDLDPALVYAVIKCESSFKSDAVSSVGAVGLMQITPDTFDWLLTKTGEQDRYDTDDLYDPEVNIQYGTYFLKLLLKEFSDVKTAVTAYHAGMGIVGKWLDDETYSSDGQTLEEIPYADTSDYVDRVIKTIDKYNTIYDFKEDAK